LTTVNLILSNPLRPGELVF